jgi:glycine hydroxymethyltransferase
MLNTLKKNDIEISKCIVKEYNRQQTSLEFIASENIVSLSVLEAQGSILTNKYAEGYPGKRYYGGCQYVDEIENLAINRAKQLFNAAFVNVQPHSGSQANQCVFLALLNPGDTILGLSLDCGGHLTHGSQVNLSGRWFNSIAYGVDSKTHELDYDVILDLALKHRPKLIIAGGSAYARKMDFKKFQDIAKHSGSLLLVDMAHFAGLVAAGYYDNPIQYADVVTTTTHKTLRGPRGGMILTNHEEIAKKINSAMFPGLQGGPLMHVIAAKAVAFHEALQSEFKTYIKNVIEGAQAMCSTLIKRDYPIITNGTDTHLFLMDLQRKNITGKAAEQILDNIGITCNKNTIPFDPTTPFITSGLRLGTPAVVTRGLKIEDLINVANIIADVLDNPNNADNYAKDVKFLCDQYPIYISIY